MTPDELIRLAQGVGFPVAVAAFVLVRLERRLRELHDALVQLRVEISRMNGRLG